MKTTFALLLAIARLGRSTPISGSQEVAHVNWDDLPWANTTEGIAKRTPGGIYICTDINWGGTCGYKVQPVKSGPGVPTCVHLTSPYLYTISSFGPDPGAVVQAFEGTNCGNGCMSSTGCIAGVITYPGYANLGDIGLNDKIGSFWAYLD